jgi:hypothetical protein
MSTLDTARGCGAGCHTLWVQSHRVPFPYQYKHIRLCMLQLADRPD